MKKIVAVLLFTSSFQGCVSNPLLESKSFNARAREFFLANMNHIELAPLNDTEKCILRETIAHDLDSLKDSPLILLYDRYLVRQYRQPFLELSFAFVEDTQDNKFYFLCLPELYKWMYRISDIYEPVPNSLYRLKVPREAIKFKNVLFKDFISSNNLRVKMNRSREDAEIAVLKNLVIYSFPDLSCSSIETYSFEKKMVESLQLGWISQSSYENIIEILDKNSSTRFVTSDVYFVNGFGYLLFHYSKNKATDIIEFDIYYLPEQQRSYLSTSQHYNYRYQKCN